MRRLPLPFALFAFSMSGAALSSSQSSLVHSAPAQNTGFVTDLPAFESFIASAPTPVQFHASYPDVQLVLPGAVATGEIRLNNSRYFAQIDAQGCICGGKFM